MSIAGDPPEPGVWGAPGGGGMGVREVAGDTTVTAGDGMVIVRPVAPAGQEGFTVVTLPRAAEMIGRRIVLVWADDISGYGVEVFTTGDDVLYLGGNTAGSQASGNPGYLQQFQPAVLWAVAPGVWAGGRGQ